MALVWLAVGTIPVAGSPTLPQRHYFIPGLQHRTFTDPLVSRLVSGDGMVFWIQAQDPTFARTSQLLGSDAHGAYRASRPLLGWAAWLLSGGQPGLVALALSAVAVASAVALALAVAHLMTARGGSPMRAILVMALPGTFISTVWAGCDLPAVALATWGLVTWTGAGIDRRRPALAAALLVLAVLTRETSLLFGIALVPFAWADEHRLLRLSQLAAAPAALGAWVALVHLRFGAWPWDFASGTLGSPFRGILDALGRGPEGPASVLMAVALGSCALAVALDGPGVLRRVGLLHAALGVVLGPWVYFTWRYFTRPLLPLGVMAVVALAAPLTAPRRTGVRPIGSPRWPTRSSSGAPASTT